MLISAEHISVTRASAQVHRDLIEASQRLNSTNHLTVDMTYTQNIKREKKAYQVTYQIKQKSISSDQL